MPENDKVDLPLPLAKFVKELHDEACAAKAQFYTDPESGWLVSTRFRLLERGTCCQSGCRHCPYGSKPGNGK